MMLDTLDDLIARLAPESLLRALAPDQLEQLLREASRRDLRPGEPIISQGDEDGDFAVVVLSGGLKITMVSASGHEIILNYCGPGELVGEIAMLDSGPRTATVIAAVPSSVLLLPSRTFLAAATANPVSAAGVMRELARRVRQLNLVIESDRTFSMAPRLARALVRLIDPARDDGRLRFDPNQSDLGAFAGLARENVSRLLSDWEAQGVIAREGRALRVSNLPFLQTLAEFGDDA
ncbi:MAG: Crp/Fnr family transcriptional regulator [Erythrobacter sp.]|uniref:Crp/Fnr family transcriptional regulator n=1 Tax=Erythrobacter sp. TaxID=1042 RepID=UPI0025D9BF89|nr:Crp/Fnr family transcriptional regulator [Erythrobacter sp.]MCL9998303.1 Crp/Fnr family transcriptional regulator [Erythrobacter sp.]